MVSNCIVAWFTLIETKLVEFGQVNWLMDAFMDKELKKLPETLSKVLSDPWNSLPILQEPESRSAMAEILSAKAEVEAEPEVPENSDFFPLNSRLSIRTRICLPFEIAPLLLFLSLVSF